MLLKPEKCHFYVKEVVFLGYIVTTIGLAIDPKKVEAGTLVSPNGITVYS